MIVIEQKPPGGSVAPVAPLKQVNDDSEKGGETAAETSTIEACPILETAIVCWLPVCPPKPSGLPTEKYATGAPTAIGAERVNAFTMGLSVTVIVSLSGPDVGTLTVA